MAKSRARGDEGLVPEIGLRLEHRRVRQQPRFAILRCAKLGSFAGGGGILR